MSQWDERISNHAIWAELEKTGAELDRALSREGIDLETSSGIERIRAVIALCGKRLAAADPILIDPRTLASISGQLSVVRTELEAFVGDGNGARIVTANSRVDDIIAFLGAIPSAVDSEEITIINAAVTAYRKAVEDYLQTALAKQRELDAASTANSQKIANVEATLTSEQQRLAALVTEQQTQFSAAQDKRASEFSTAQADQQAKFSASSSEQQAQFSMDQDSRKTAFSDAARENQDKVSKLLADYTQQLKDQETLFAENTAAQTKANAEDLETLKSEYESNAASLLSQIQKHKSDVEKLVGVIGNLGVTSGYLTVANHARKMLYLWQSLTVLALGGLIVIAFMMAFPHEKPSPAVTLALVQKSDAQGVAKDTQKSEVAQVAATSVSTPQPSSDSAFYQGFATRVFLSLTFGIFAAYAARQATRFLEIEQKNRKRALELEAFGPFIEPLDKEMKDKFRLEIGERSFAVPDQHPQKHAEEEPVTALALLKSKEVSEFFSNLIKAAKS